MRAMTLILIALLAPLAAAQGTWTLLTRYINTMPYAYETTMIQVPSAGPYSVSYSFSVPWWVQVWGGTDNPVAPWTAQFNPLSNHNEVVEGSVSGNTTGPGYIWARLPTTAEDGLERWQVNRAAFWTRTRTWYVIHYPVLFRYSP